MDESHFSLQKTVVFIYALVTAFVLILVLFFNSIPHAVHVKYAANTVLVFCGTVIVLSIAIVIKRMSDFLPFSTGVVLFVSCILLVFQIIAVRQYFFSSGWDVYGVFSSSLREAKNLYDDNEIYFQRYPNNLLLLFIFSRLLKLVFSWGFSELEGYFAFIVLQCAISWISGLLTYFCTLKITGKYKTGMIAYALYVVFICVSPWVSIPYSDSLGLVFPLSILYSYLDDKNEKTLGIVFRWIFIGFLTYFGYKIKPQIVIVTIAIILAETLKLFRNRVFYVNIIRILCFFLGIVFSLFCTKLMCSQLNIQPDREKSVSMVHYVSMGLNPETMGIYSQTDVVFASSFDTLSERNAAEWEQAINRVKELGGSGVLLQWIRKTLTTYSDGMFGWGQAGTFFRQFFPEPDNRLAPFLRSLYYLDGSRYRLLSNYEQCLWLGILTLSCIPCFKKGKHYIETVVMLSLIGLFIFESVFEAGARYLYIYLPFYVILAAEGAELLLTKIRKRSVFANENELY